ncbi:MAG: amino acid adenylation domain-containing protein, partial [Psychrosphaera sp.]|nr:amino acid adenylation domain-containing protein [Psychrosphaera sp.]
VHGYYDALLQGRTPTVEVDTAYLNTQAYYQNHQAQLNLHWHDVHFEQANDINALLGQTIDLSQAQVLDNPCAQTLTVSAKTSAVLKASCREQEVTLNVAAQFAWHKLLHIYTQDAQTIVGTTVSGRDMPVEGIESSVGLYINTLPLAVNWSDNATIAQMLADIHQNMALLNTYSAVDLAKLQHQSERLFHSLFVFENYPTPVASSGIEQQMTIRQGIEKVDYPLSVLAYENEGSLNITLNYDPQWLSDEQAQRLLNQLYLILTAVANNPALKHHNIELISDSERQQLMAWNQTDAPYPQDKTLHQVFEEQVKKTPDNIALVFEGKSLTYHALNSQANQLAHVIQSQHAIKPDTCVALYLDRSLATVISILAVLKAGGAYVPISPDYPKTRTDFILNDTKAPIVLTQGHLLNDITAPIVIDVEELESAPTKNLPLTSSANDLAYVIYTSGTTGQPKGVMVEHRGVVNLAAAQVERFGLTDCHKTLLFADYVFDASVSELFMALHHGLAAYLCNDNQRKDIAALELAIIEQQIEVLTLPPVVLPLLGDTALESLKVVITEGETPALAVLDKISQKARVYNAYGPTEVSVCASAKRYQNGELASNIGHAINNTRLYVCSAQGQLLPPGVPGELHVGGIGLARGYLNQPGLTAASFIDNPFGTGKLYKTGDKVRMLVNGELEFLGRFDAQVKIRGFRVELTAIENTLNAADSVKQAVVVDVEHTGHKALAAYVVSEPGTMMNADTLQTYLSDLLPEYMVPASFNAIETVPLTVNGKLDKKALPEPLWGNIDDYVAPRNAVEVELCAIWMKVLGLAQVGIFDNFFSLGGDSIVSIQLVSKLRQSGFELQVKTIFDAPTVAQLAVVLAVEQGQVEVQAEQGELSGEFGLLPIQTWFFEQDFDTPAHWNQGFMVRVPCGVSYGEIELALGVLASQHDILRCAFKVKGFHHGGTEARRKERGKDQKQNYRSKDELGNVDLRALDVKDLNDLTELQNDFDLEQGPLWRAVHLTGYEDGSARLFFASHHLIMDSVSWRIIADDLEQLLTGQVLGKKTSSYRQWVGAIANYSDTHTDESTYWNAVTQNMQALPAPVEKQHQHIELSAGQTQALLTQAAKGFHTQINDLLLSALGITLKTVFNRNTN